MQKLKAVIFDLDGTLANTLPLCISAFRQSIEPLAGRTISDAEIIATFGPSEEGTVMALAPHHFDKGVSDYLRIYEESHAMCPAPFEGIIPVLDFLKEKDIRIAMVTGKGKVSADISLDKFGVAHYFELLETGMLQGPSKPKGIKSILDVWTDIAKDEVIYVGDAPSDITACRQVGIPIIAAAWAETAEPELLASLQPDELFYSVHDFAAWLQTQV
ncbi:HAD hydrolase-like protein [Flavobacterium sp. DGU11]|uniref:phosphoglycolate phosphatase n=1 Tax=Flavobacterium arundinis TaxID=3139143 RepID=A0ABU9HXC8_9FLAO